MLAWLVALAAVLCVGETNDRVILEFRSPQCPACDHLQPVLDQLVQEGWVVRPIDIERDRAMAERWRVRQVPTMVVVAKGEEVDRIVGYVPLEELRPRLQGRKSRSMPPANSNLQAFALSANDASETPVVPASHAMASSPTNPASTAPQTPSPLPSDPQGATVRIRVDDGGTESVGTGTIIDTHGNEALVLTCGHLFRDGQGKSALTVEVFQNGKPVRLPAKVVDYRADDVDIGLLAFQAPFPVSVARLLPKSSRLEERQAVYSYGCDAGADPSRRDSHITKLNRYLGPSNVEVANAPIQGRSGGGLFDANHRLIGVCFAADQEHDEGLYSGPDVVYTQLNRLGLGRLYHDGEFANATQPASNSLHLAQGNTDNNIAPAALQDSGWPANSTAPNAVPVNASAPRSISRQGLQPILANPDPYANPQRANPSAGSNPGLPSGGGQVIAVIREPGKPEQVITIPVASPQLLQAIQQAGSVQNR